MRTPTEMNEEVDEAGDRSGLAGAPGGGGAACDVLALDLDLDLEPNFIVEDGMISAFGCDRDGPRSPEPARDEDGHP